MTSSSTGPATPEWSLHSFRGRPGSPELEALAQLARAAEDADGHPPFNEQTWVQLRSGDDADAVGGVLALLRGGPEHDDAEAAGAAVVIAAGDGSFVIEMVVRPEDRGHGIGTDLSAALETALQGKPVQAWSHGDDRGAALLAARHGLEPVRELWRMRRSTAAGAATATRPAETNGDTDSTADPGAVVLPDGVEIRPFRVGVDEAAWLAVNAAAFATHPEQGRMTLSDLQERERSEWFDPAGFLLAWDADGTLLGFHWTKVHAAHTDPRGVKQDAIGEVYAVGIAPQAQGRGLGKALTLAGMEHLKAAGLGTIMLYVDADNEAAVRLYRKLGFERWDGDVMYARSAG